MGTGLNAKERKRLKHLELMEEKRKKGEPADDIMEPDVEEEAPKVREPPKVSVPAFGLNTLPMLKDTMKAFVMPQTTVWDKTAEQIVNEAKICADSAKTIELRTKISKYQGIIEQEDDSDKDAAYMECMKKLLKDAEASLAQLTKGSTGVSSVERMKSKLQEAQTKEVERLETLDGAEAKMTAKMDDMQDAFDLQIAELVYRKEEYMKCRTVVAKAWQQDGVERLSRFQSIKAAWEEKIAAEELWIKVAKKEVKEAQVAAQSRSPAVEEEKDEEVDELA